MSNAFSGVGTAFQRSDGASSPTYTAIAEVNQIQGPGATREFIDVTSLDSVGGWREFIGGFRDGGQVTLNMNFTRSGYDDMLTDFLASSSVDYRIDLPDDENTQISFAGWVTDLPVTVPTDDKVTLDVTIKVDGAITVASG